MSVKYQGKYLQYTGQCNLTEHVMCITHNCQVESRIERKQNQETSIAGEEVLLLDLLCSLHLHLVLQ